MRDPLERRPENRPLHPDPVPPMPAHLPAGDGDNPHTSPLRHDQDTEPLDTDLPPEPSNDPTP